MKGERRKLLLFPLPFQGHVTPMLHLASVLHSKGFSITIIQANFNFIDPNKFPHFAFRFLDDGLSSSSLPPDSTNIISLLNSSCMEPFRNCLGQVLSGNEPVSCLIVDPMWGFTKDVADSFNLPRISIRTGSMSAFVVYDSLPLLRATGYYPLQEAKLDEPVPELPPLKVKDLPPESFHDMLFTLVEDTKTSQAVICNTFEELESSALAKVWQSLPIPVFPIGPLHKLSPPAPSISIMTQDQTSISWLNTQAHKSVLYISFGSAVMMSEAAFLEIAWGLAKSNQPFLWVVRPGLVQGSETYEPASIEGYLEKVSGRGHIVKWAPQQEVLAHPSVGGFWTHCGWNSTLETISEGVPMICLPFYADQVVTARYVNDCWGVGLRLGRGANREVVEKAIRRLMVEQEGEEMRNRMTNLKKKATLTLLEGGSSHTSLEKLTSYLLSL